jgi:DNA invertase Pin-like site-specific DNA recombinase
MQKWRGRPPKLDEDEAEKLREIIRSRVEQPSNAELARRFGISPRSVATYGRGEVKRYQG